MESSPVLLLSKAFGCANIFSSATAITHRQKFFNYSYRIAILFVLIYAFASQPAILKSLITSGNLIQAGKIVIEVLLYWSTLYISYIKLLIKNKECDELIIKMTKYGKQFKITKKINRVNLFFWILISIITLLQITFYSTIWFRLKSEETVMMSYFLNKFTVNLINYQLSYLLWILKLLFEEVNNELKEIRDKAKFGKILNKLTCVDLFSTWQS